MLGGAFNGTRSNHRILQRREAEVTRFVRTFFIDSLRVGTFFIGSLRVGTFVVESLRVGAIRIEALVIGAL